MAGYIIVFWQLDFIIAAGIPNVKSTLSMFMNAWVCPQAPNLPKKFKFIGCDGAGLRIFLRVNVDGW